ncbi:MAG: DNA repair protein RecO [Pedobacter sp.]|uniref:DNA repair protein RecO n=1 Tax=Pedobacter sp. TaxID=1411316 RepID=UPI002806AD6B|nr:DNA repair protein RecO [Pedobacter sp.]MDQ8004657.1 DNA repair protein RecO [Pedobacter sp.]
MLYKTRGIVLKTINYNESSVVVQVFTEKFGIQSYLVNGVKKAKAKIPINFLQPLHLLDMVVYHKQNTQIQRVSEARPMPMFKSIPYNVIKNTIVQFLNEVLYKSIRQQHVDEQLFEYLYNAISWFDESEELSVNFHLSFLMKLTRFLGFAPQPQTRPDQKYFDLQEGNFTSLSPMHPYFTDDEQGNSLLLLLNTSIKKINEVRFTNAYRRLLLDKILIYYQLHTASFGQVKSHQILEEVLS